MFVCNLKSKAVRVIHGVHELLFVSDFNQMNFIHRENVLSSSNRRRFDTQMQWKAKKLVYAMLVNFYAI